MSPGPRKLVYFDTWIDPVADEVLATAPWIEVIR